MDLQEIASGISDPADVGVPSDLWDSIEHRLEANFPMEGSVTPNRSFGSRRWAWAASLVFLVGLGIAGLSLVKSSARASAIDFGVLLDALPRDAQRAFGRFLVLYDARLVSPPDAKKLAPLLDFDTPPTLPGNFRLESVYLLRFGDHPGVAASYKRGDEFLAAIFHAPVKNEDYGTHKDYACAIGKHRGHKVEVGTWKMVHLTDPTTCHCVLSQLDESSELPAVMAAVAPRSTGSPSHDHHD